MFEDSLIGFQLDEYRLQALLGQGGMARVYRALDINLNRTVAIKVIDKPYRADAEYGHRFKREAQAIAQLDHPNIVRLYRYGEVNGLLYIAMQFIHGADLRYLLSKYREEGSYIEPAEASRIIREIGEALDYAHSMGVIHRDIKSSNIMLNQHGQAILTDFGLAFLDNQALPGEALGSPHYVSPEQAQSSSFVSAQSDLYSLGVILYEMFTGQRPFTANDPVELAWKHVHETPPAPNAIRPEINQEIERVIMKAMAKDPGERYSSGKALADELEAALLNQTLLAGAAGENITERVQRKLQDSSPTAATALQSPRLIQSPPPPQENQPSAWMNDHPNWQPPPPGGTGSLLSRINRLWVFGLLGGLMALLICLGGSFLVLRSLLFQDGNGQTAGEDIAGPMPLVTISPTPSPTLLVPLTGLTLTSVFSTSTASPTPSFTPETPTLTLTPTQTLPPPTITPTPLTPTLTDTSRPSATSTNILTLTPTLTIEPTNTASTPSVTRSLSPTFPSPTTEPTETQLSPTVEPSLTLTVETMQPTATEETKISTPSPDVTAPPNQAGITRSGITPGFLVIENTGSGSLLLEELRLESENGEIFGAVWEVEVLDPGECVLAWSEEFEDDDPGLPDAFDCELTGDTLWIESEDAWVFVDEMLFWVGNDEAGICEENEEECTLQLP